MQSLANSASFQKMPSVNGDQVTNWGCGREAGENLPRRPQYQLLRGNCSFPRVHEWTWVRPSKKAESKGTFVHRECFKPLTKKFSLLFLTCTFPLWKMKSYHWALMHVESSLLRKLNFNNVLDQFVDRLTRKMFKGLTGFWYCLASR